KIKYLCTDGNYAYDKVNIAQRHLIGKSETCFVESMNAKIRRKLARFNRKTCRYSKAIDMVIASLILFLTKKLLNVYLVSRPNNPVVRSDGYVIQQGYLESSNVDSIKTMVDMISAHRNYDILSKAIQSEDSTLEKTVNQIGKL
ncbi:MAG: hypothetical protein LBH98_04655, partial [Chitinispirillales bacterium]|nr:hypothetical protein [Chitinispirillales bacterium]